MRSVTSTRKTRRLRTKTLIVPSSVVSVGTDDEVIRCDEAQHELKVNVPLPQLFCCKNAFLFYFGKLFSVFSLLCFQKIALRFCGHISSVNKSCDFATIRIVMAGYIMQECDIEYTCCVVYGAVD